MMKRILTILLFTLMFGSAAIAGNVIKTEYITEEVCKAINGCWVDPKNGNCPDCVTITRTIVTEVEEEKKEPVVARIEKPKKSKGKWVCVVGPCDF